MTKIDKLIFKQCRRRPGYDYFYVERGGWVAEIQLVANFWLVSIRYYDENIYSEEFSFTEYGAALDKCQEIYEDFMHRNLIWRKEIIQSKGVTYVDYRHVSPKRNCVYQIYHRADEAKYLGNILWKEYNRIKKIEAVDEFTELGTPALFRS